jgi:biopolymer transport protein ExbD
MPKIKAPRSSPSIDMTPMVDLFFLLVTFFMLTATFRNEEPVTVDTPKSTSEKILPDNTMLITIDTAGRVFYSIEGQEIRKALLKDMGEHYGVTFSSKQVETFARLKSIGMPVAQLPGYLDMKASERKALDKQTKGIPIDTAITEKNELAFWINFGQREAAVFLQNKKAEDPNFPGQDLRFAIKADGETAYKKVKDVINVFKKQNIYTFNLVTSQEAK